MNKKVLIEQIAERLGTTQKAAREHLEATIDVIADALAEGTEVKIFKFGTFSVVERAARMGHNPATGEAMRIEATKSPKFKPSSYLKSLVRGEEVEE